jgi:hypothetical protein
MPSRRDECDHAIPLSDFELPEIVEDRIDLEDARNRLNEPTTAWPKIKKDLGL